MASWEKNRDYILRKLSEGTAGDRTGAFEEWKARYEASGTPTDAAGMMSKAEYGNFLNSGVREELEGAAGLTMAQGGAAGQAIAPEYYQSVAQQLPSMLSIYGGTGIGGLDLSNIYKNINNLYTGKTGEVYKPPPTSTYVRPKNTLYGGEGFKEAMGAGYGESGLIKDITDSIQQGGSNETIWDLQERLENAKPLLEDTDWDAVRKEHKESVIGNVENWYKGVDDPNSLTDLGDYTRYMYLQQREGKITDKEAKQAINARREQMGLPKMIAGGEDNLGLKWKYDKSTKKETDNMYEDVLTGVGGYWDNVHGSGGFSKMAASLGRNPMVQIGLGALTGGLGSAVGGGFLGGAVQGGTNALLSGALQGDFDFGDIAKGAAMGGITSSGKDFLKDTFTYDRPATLQMAADKGIIDPWTAENQIALQGTTDLGKLVGPNGLLSGIGLDEYMDVSGLQNAYGKVIGMLPQDLMEKLYSNPGAMTQDELRKAVLGAYDERFYDFASPRGDSEFIGIHENSPGGRGNSFMEAIDKGNWGQFGSNIVGGAGDALADTILPDVGGGYDWLNMAGDAAESISAINDKEAQLPNTGYTPIADDIFGVPSQPEFVTPEELEGTQDDSGLTLGGREDMDPLPAYPADEVLPQDPQYDESVQETPLPTDTSTTAPTSGTTAGPPKSRKAPEYKSRKEREGELFRLASIMQVQGLPADVRQATAQRIQMLLGEQEEQAYAGDVTKRLDKKAGRQVSRYKEKDLPAELFQQDAIQKAIDEANA